MKYFIITVDTEGDNLWEYKDGDTITTNNVLYIPRFQKLCEKYGFKPVYLTNYEMICDDRFVSYIKPKAEAGLCEIGIHVHAWNNPPLYQLTGPYNGNPYLIEYPEEIMKEKFKVTYDLICEKIGIPPISHRAGRWAMNTIYFHLLKEFKIAVDCSYTPGISWTNTVGKTIGGSDYAKEKNVVSIIDGIVEVPATVERFHLTNQGSLKVRLRKLLRGYNAWLRPAYTDYQTMCRVIKKHTGAETNDFVEFMIHSSELMEGGSPYYKAKNDIENQYQTMEMLFRTALSMGFTGATLREFYCNLNITKN